MASTLKYVFIAGKYTPTNSAKSGSDIQLTNQNTHYFDKKKKKMVIF